MLFRAELTPTGSTETSTETTTTTTTETSTETTTMGVLKVYGKLTQHLVKFQL